MTGTLGSKIKSMRLEKRLTLRQVAVEAGCSVAFISQIEHDKASPSIATLKRIAHTLGARIVDFFIEEVSDEPIVLSKDQWIKVSLARWRADIRQMSRSSNHRKMQPFYTIIQPGGGAPEAYSHEGEEFGLVLDGELTLKVGRETHIVAAGSSFYYSSLLPHAWTNESDQPCRVIWVVTPPSW